MDSRIEIRRNVHITKKNKLFANALDLFCIPVLYSYILGLHVLVLCSKRFSFVLSESKKRMIAKILHTIRLQQ
jgi:hypothetical protein